MNAPVRRGSWIVTLPMAAIAAGYVWLAFLPGERKIKELRNELRGKQEFIMGAGQMHMQLQEATAELDETRRYNATRRPPSSASAGVSALFGEIAQLAKESGVTTTHFAPGGDTAFERVHRVPLTLACDGTYNQVQSLLAGLESTGNHIWITELKLQSIGQDGQTVHCELTLALFVEESEKSG